MIKNTKGFGLVAVLLLLVGLGIIGYAGWFVYSTNQKANETYAPASTDGKALLSAEKLTKSYTMSTGIYSIKYPATWKLAEEKMRSWSDTEPIVNTTLTSPRGTVLHINFDWGGRGGACEPATTDKPFQAGNECSTTEYLTLEKTNINNVYDNIATITPTSYSDALGKSNIVLISDHYMDTVGKSRYYIGLTKSNTDFPVVLNEPKMGYGAPQGMFHIYDAKGKWHGDILDWASFTDKAQLNTQDAKTVKAIFKSTTINLP